MDLNIFKRTVLLCSAAWVAHCGPLTKTKIPDAPVERPRDAKPQADPASESAQTFVQEIMPIVVDIARTSGLSEAIGAALRDPRAADLGPILAEQMRFKDRVDFDPDAVNGPPVGALETR